MLMATKLPQNGPLVIDAILYQVKLVIDKIIYEVILVIDKIIYQVLIYLPQAQPPRQGYIPTLVTTLLPSNTA